MSINFGAGNNGGRYFTTPQHADFALGDHTWLAVITPWTGSSSNPQYLLSAGGYEVNPSINLFLTSGVSSFAYAFSGGNVQTASSIESLSNNLVFGRRSNGVVTAGRINLSTGILQLSGTRNFATVVQPPGALTVGGRQDKDAYRFFQGHISWLCCLSRGLTNQEITDLATGTKVLVNDFAGDIVELWDMSVNAATITGLYKGHVLTRFGTGYGADGADPLPFQTGSTPISFTGSVANQNVTKSVPVNIPLDPYFIGSLTPFAYSLQAGSLPTGLSISGNAIVGTPAMTETQSGLVIRGTDTGTNTADSNSFNITVNPPISVVLTGSNVRQVNRTTVGVITPNGPVVLTGRNVRQVNRTTVGVIISDGPVVLTGRNVRQINRTTVGVIIPGGPVVLTGSNVRQVNRTTVGVLIPNGPVVLIGRNVRQVNRTTVGRMSDGTLPTWSHDDLVSGYTALHRLVNRLHQFNDGSARDSDKPGAFSVTEIEDAISRAAQSLLKL